jgi:predicted RNase H-like nuclease (RuvC/YqgF family)
MLMKSKIEKDEKKREGIQQILVDLEQVERTLNECEKQIRHLTTEQFNYFRLWQEAKRENEELKGQNKNLLNGL